MFNPTHDTDKKNKTFKESFVDFYHEINGLIPVNFWWFLLCIPIVTIPPATAGLFYAAYKNKKGEAVNRKTFFEGFKQYALFSYIRTGVNLLLLFIFMVGFSVYTQMDWQFSNLLAGLLGLFALVWVLLQVLSLPVVFEMKTKNYFYAMRNSFLLFFLKPGRTLSTLILNVIVLALSILTIVPLVLLTGAIISMNSLFTMDDALDKLNKTVAANRERMGLDPETDDEELDDNKSKFPPMEELDEDDKNA